MEADHTTQDDPPEGNNIENHEKTPRKQLQMAVSVQLPVMQDVYEHGQRKIVQSHERNKVQTARKSFKKPPLKGPQNLQGTSISGKILRFSCSECKGNTTFSPNDLSKHFQGVHQGSLPTFPCDLCGYITQDFSNLQRHRLGHRDTFVRCEVCNDSVQYTLLQLTRHFSMYHSQNGLYRCERCNFSTKDVGTIVQHIHRHNEIQYKCPKCKHVSYTSGEFQKHLLVHSGKFSCQFCDYRAPRKDYIIRHMNSAHSKEKKKWRVKAENSKTLMNSSPGLKLLLTKNPARETWMSKRLHALSGGGLLEEYGKLSNPEKTLEETQQFLERTVASEKESKKWIKALKTEQQFVSQAIPSLSQSKFDSPVTPNVGFMNPSSNGLTVLMVKNKISIPPNCTTKVMGFKMVDGKKHLVLKVIPSGKQEATPKTGLSSSAVKEMDRHTSETLLTEVNSSDCAVYGVEQTSSQLNSSNLDSSKSTALVGLDPLVRRNSENSCVVQKNGDEQPSHPVRTEESRILTFSEAKNNNDQFPLLEVSATAANIGPANEKSLLKSSMEEASEIKGATSFAAFANALKPTVTQQEQRCIALEEMHSPTDCEENITIDSESNSGLNSSSEKVFSFHNYSKDTSSFSSDVSLPIEDQSYSELLTDGPEPNSSKIASLADSNRTPDDSSMASVQDCHNDEIPEQLLLNSDPLMEKVPDSEIEVDECIATVEEESNGLNNFPGLACRPDATLKSTSQREGKQSLLLGNNTDLNEERETNIDDFGSATEHENHVPEKGLDGSCIQKVPGSSCNAAALGRILEEHSDAIISQQLEKERIGTAVTNGVFRQATTTLRILQPFNVKDGIKTSGSSQASIHAPITVSQLQKFSSATIQGKTGEKSASEGLNNKLKRVRLPQPRSNHQLAKRKKKRKSHSQDPSEPLAKSKRHSSKKNKEKDAFPDVVNWKPVPKDVERTLRLSPFCPSQLIKCPRRNQPVIVLNHPDVDIPEVTNIMRTVGRYKGEVLKVALSQRTVDALSELSCNPFKRSHSVPDNSSHGRHSRRENTARERFILKLKLKKTSRNKYQVVNTTSDSTERSSSFSCWFCGRIFDNQEEWIGHGQRHLMEATRDWNKLF
ncbi:zinc finger protein 518A isoform X2 [Paramormyrops kingsleyae]|uniref:zinc finger protein 518A isoform X2 n=1 Tax=Paramormyrops kingsleyae TaxID=1676925 RepID=UPI003B978336